MAKLADTQMTTDARFWMFCKHMRVFFCLILQFTSNATDKWSDSYSEENYGGASEKELCTIETKIKNLGQFPANNAVYCSHAITAQQRDSGVYCSLEITLDILYSLMFKFKSTSVRASICETFICGIDKDVLSS